MREDMKGLVEVQGIDSEIARKTAIIEAIPKNPYGKVLKRELREKYWVGEARRVR